MDGEREVDDAAARVEVPHAELAPGVLRRLVEEFVTRDGTDYGAVERTLAEKVAAVMQQLESGELAIVVDLSSEAIDIVSRQPASAGQPY
jgi:uncharacterized protein YheU (UPF0270 family)